MAKNPNYQVRTEEQRYLETEPFADNKTISFFTHNPRKKTTIHRRVSDVTYFIFSLDASYLHMTTTHPLLPGDEALVSLTKKYGAPTQDGNNDNTYTWKRPRMPERALDDFAALPAVTIEKKVAPPKPAYERIAPRERIEKPQKKVKIVVAKEAPVSVQVAPVALETRVTLPAPIIQMAPANPQRQLQKAVETYLRGAVSFEGALEDTGFDESGLYLQLRQRKGLGQYHFGVNLDSSQVYFAKPDGGLPARGLPPNFTRGVSVNLGATTHALNVETKSYIWNVPALRRFLDGKL